ncbi:FISUMP domain-containing protein [Flammeovirga sp. SubArs3]|uniref:FISUMP domain-containing protein n=1 Tax=Flammeovirga sp. SubArs3 TaxID=2995316 RepID=UPI00248CDE32|nr:FISUMP domain-containing protein [Flammeovirga sp. SubArs3]
MLTQNNFFCYLLFFCCLGCTSKIDQQPFDFDEASVEEAFTLSAPNYHDNKFYKKPQYFIDERNQEKYPTVQIKNSIWLAENIRYPLKGSIEVEIDNQKDKEVLYFNHHIEKVCPKGWHVPTDEDWDSLEIFLGLEQNIVEETGWRGHHSKALKAAQYWPVKKERNKFSFNAIPTGFYLQNNGHLGRQHCTGYFAIDLEGNVWERWIMKNVSGVSKVAVNENNTTALPCRCVKNKEKTGV